MINVLLGERNGRLRLFKRNKKYEKLEKSGSYLFA